MENISTKKWFKIGEAAKKLNIAVETIRMYEREGLLITEKTEGGQRIFDDNDLHWIGCIRRLINEQGLNIEGIRRLLALIPCWDLRPCSEEERKICPAYLHAIKPCWMIKAETAGDCIADNCRYCVVYQNALKCNDLKTLLYQLRNQ